MLDVDEWKERFIVKNARTMQIELEGLKNSLADPGMFTSYPPYKSWNFAQIYQQGISM